MNPLDFEPEFPYNSPETTDEISDIPPEPFKPEFPHPFPDPDYEVIPEPEPESEDDDEDEDDDEEDDEDKLCIYQNILTKQ